MTIDANDLERMAKERPDERFLKGSGVLKLIGAIRQLEGELSTARELADEMFATLTAALFLAPHNSPVRAALDEAVENIRPKWLRPAASVISFPDPNLGPKTDHFPLPPAKAQAYADNNGLPPAGVQEARESDLAAFAARVRPPVPDSDERIEEAAKMLWHRFAPGHREDWNDEPHKDEYRSAARALLAGSASIADKALKRDAWLNETCAELWAMAQGPVPISNAVDRMVNHLRERLQGKGGA